MIGLGAASGWLMENVRSSPISADASRESQGPVRPHDCVFFAILGLAAYLSIGTIAATTKPIVKSMALRSLRRSAAS